MHYPQSALQQCIRKHILNLLNLLLRPFEISLCLMRTLHAFSETDSRFRKSGSSLSLKSEQFAVLRIELSGPVIKLALVIPVVAFNIHLSLLHQIFI